MPVPTRPIAIVGVSVELPSGVYSDENLDHHSFFEFLFNSGNAYEELPTNRFNFEAWKGNALGTIHAQKGAFLKDVDLFDNVEFGISSTDARAMAPATRKLLENSFLALLDSGIDYRSKRVGVYTAGTSIELTNVAEPDELEVRGSFAGYPSMIANRISCHLDLLGPSIPVDTACSSTLSAMHLAIQGLIHDDCEAAIVGGCQLNHRLVDWITYSQGSLLSREGKCKPFDISADGFSRAEGCVVVVIKPLEDALRDHDHIYGTILGSSINSSGSGAPPGAPVAESQRAAMIEAFQRAGRSPRDVDFVELHATGTAKGDPTEANWVGEAFQRERELLVGSVKGNIGHTEVTAFLASLSKVLSIFERRTIPPTVNIKTLNPAIRWYTFRMRVPLLPEPLPTPSGRKPLISIAASGIGGSNGHVVLESAPPRPRLSRFPSKVDLPTLLVCGGLSNRTATEISNDLRERAVNKHANLAGLSTVLGRRSRQMTWRSFAVVHPSDPPPSFSPPQLVPRHALPIAMVFSGQGTQHVDMGRQLFGTFPAFRQSVLEMDEVFRRITNSSIIHDHHLFAGQSTNLPEPWPISLVLPAICIFQIALFDLLVSLGVKPNLLIGHSAGETAVIYASGAAPKAMAVELAIIRGQCFTPIEEMGGAMAAVSCTLDDVQELIDQSRRTDEVVDVACYNSPTAVAIAGHERAVDDVVRAAGELGIFARKIRTRVPIHSSMMEACWERYLEALDQLFKRYPGVRKPCIPTYSTLTGKLVDAYECDYFWRSTRDPVLFVDAVTNLTTDHPTATFLEIGSHPVLGSYISSMALDSLVLPTVYRPKRGASTTEHVDFLTVLGRLSVAGHNCVDFTLLNSCACYEAQVDLPKYPFAKKRWPLYPDTQGYHKQISPRNGPLNHQYLRFNKDTHPSLADHIIRGEPIMPAAGFLEMAIEFGATTLLKVDFRGILSLSSETPVPIAINLDGAHWTVKTTGTTSSGLDNAERLHAEGLLSFETPPSLPDVDLSEIRKRCTNHVHSGFYSSLSYFSSYGPHFQRVTNVYFGFKEALVSVVGLDTNLAEEGAYFLHPAVLDACLQVTAYKAFHGDYNPSAYYLPSKIDAFVVHQKPRRHYFPYHVYAHIQLKEWVPDGIVYDIGVFNDSGTRLCTFQGLKVAKHRIQPIAEPSVAFEIAAQLVCDRQGAPITSGPGFLLPSPPSNVPNGYPQPNGIEKPHEASTPPLSTQKPCEALYKPESSFTFSYRYGEEADLQWELSGLNIFQTLDVWIITKEGRDGGAARGLVGALRKECSSWTIRLVQYPENFDEEARLKALSTIPIWMQDETDFWISENGDISVPRITPISFKPNGKGPDRGIRKEDKDLLPLDHIGVRLEASSKQGQVVGFVGQVTDANWTTFNVGSFVVGILNEKPKENIVIDVDDVHHLPECLHSSIQIVPHLVPGFISALLAPGISAFCRGNRLVRQRILLTHSGSLASHAIIEVYRQLHLAVSTVPNDASLLELANIKGAPFDLIITEYEDKPHQQVLRSLLQKNGRLYNWTQELQDTLTKDPSLINDALQHVFSLMEDRIGDIDLPHGLLDHTISPVHHSIPASDELVREQPRSAKFDSMKSYILLGGVGTLGAHLALFMYQRGARNIVLTSRSGEAGLEKNENLVVRRMFEYLKGREDLHIRLVAVDATDPGAMAEFMLDVSPAVGGCVVLSGVLRDRHFQNLTEEDFSIVYRSKLGVLEAMNRYLDVEALDFVVAFSSVTGLIGIPGQTNYNAANAALEEEVAKFRNGFAFVCPGILDSTMMLAGADERKAVKLRRLTEWSISAEDMIPWFEDAICKFQSGHRFSRYIPTLDWKVIEKAVGMPRIGKHLVPPDEVVAVTEGPATDAIADIICSVLGVAKSDFSAATPLTAYGIDSLSASKISFRLRPILEVSQIQLLASTCLNDLHRMKQQAARGRQAQLLPVDQTKKGLSKPETMQGYVERYLPQITHEVHPLENNRPSSTLRTVIVTGTTGSLGSHLLQRLVQDDTVERIFALNRPGSSSLLERQQRGFDRLRLPSHLLSSRKLMLLEVDFLKNDYGLDNTTLSLMESSVTDIVHNGMLRVMSLDHGSRSSKLIFR
ncbi:CurK protein, variant 2 [Coprinopsis cinerea AmutBmut pab1-1]|nr:CurK protein, variant 2 [Coprinopsis cinerea AmutBmut pab1-1]